MRSVLQTLGRPYVIENVQGARHALLEPFELHGQLFGLEQDRLRLFETGGGFTLTAEGGLFASGQALRQGSCLGRRRRFPRNDPFGRRIETSGRAVCCEGNIWATQGSSPHYGTLVDHAASMGIDAGHMTYAELSQAVPPDYSAFIVGQAAMHWLSVHYGVESVSLDQLEAGPALAQATMRHLLRGAGGTSATAGLKFVRAPSRANIEGGSQTSESVECPSALVWEEDANRTPVLSTPSSEVDASHQVSRARWSFEEHALGRLSQRSRGVSSAAWSLTESDFRELDYTHAGDYDQVSILGSAPNWTARLHACRRLRPEAVARRSVWHGKNTFVHRPGERVAEALARVVSDPLEGGRITVIVSDADEVGRLVEAGFRRVACWGVGHQVLGLDREQMTLHAPAVALSFGRRECALGEGLHLDQEAVQHYMDPRDRGHPSCGKGAKAALAWSWLQRHPERWRGAGFPADVEKMMTEGVEIDALGDDRAAAQEVGQYPFADAEHFVKGSQECDRALMCGHLELVPEGEVEWSLSHGSVHPWTVVHQSEDKWRSCQDYKKGTNARVISSPFTLCNAHDVAAVVRPDTHFAKFDLRDGFWSVPVAPGSRHHLMVRHPATGRLLRCTSLPFGFAKSPQHFCRVTEAVADKFRQRLAAAGITGIHIFCFVDDYLLAGDTKELTQKGMLLFSQLLDELGLPFAPHKTRGPTRVIEFLGFLLTNVVEARCISLTGGRQRRMLELISEWLAMEPAEGMQPATADPRELASVLGQLVFASAVVPDSRVYMQAMLSQFAGLQVDWARGMVRRMSSQWQRIQLREGFFRDLHWWRSALLGPNCVPFDRPTIGEIAIVGTDASDLACGELVWLDGAREETMLLFTEAERRRPINFRELRGTLRALEVWDSRLSGRLALIETDNTFGHETTGKLRCKAEDSQELVRRIHARARRHDISLRSVHTPGVMLTRPDQTSRGSAPEEPRLRLTRGSFSPLERRFGPFDEFLGAERELAGKPAPLRAFSRLWAHPSFDTVGSTLRTICERLRADQLTCPRGVVVVPFAPEAGWWKLTRHFACVGGWEAGRAGLEAAVAGVWQPALSTRPTLLLAFPRAGSMLLPLVDAVMLGEEHARSQLYRHPAIDRVSAAWVNRDSPLPAGTLLYSARRLTSREVADRPSGAAGVLYLTREPFTGAGLPACAELIRLGNRSHRHHFSLEKASYDRRGGGEGGLWRPDVSSLWVVNHLGGRLVTQPGTSRRDQGVTRYIFDFDAAESEIVRMRAALTAAHFSGAEESEVAGGEAVDELEVAADLAAVTPTREQGGDEHEVAMSGYSAGAPPERLRVAKQMGLAPPEGEGAASDLAEAQRVLSPADGEGMRAAMRSAEAGRRRHQAPLPAMGISEPTRCHYAGMTCCGCQAEMGLDAWMIPGGVGMVHNDSRCYAAATQALAESVATAEEGEIARRRLREGPSALGAATSQADAEAGPVGAPDLEELRPSIRDGLLASKLTSKPAKADANQRVVQLDESLSEERRAMVRECIEGRCEHRDSNEPVMTCIGSCHRQIHGVKCAQLAHGHALLAVFECAQCRLAKIVSGGGPYTEAAIRGAEETMICEMSRGEETTGAAYADFVKLEARWAAEMGGAGVKLPSDSVDSLKLFLLWLIRVPERARSLGSLWRAMGSYMTKSGRANLTIDPGVKAHYSSLLDKHGIEEHPRTSATPRMMNLMINEGGVDMACPSPLISARTKLDYGMEAGMGVRVGEAMGAGDYHGVKASHACILRQIDTGLETCELMLEHSKTKHKRWTNCLGTTLGVAKLPLADLFRGYWKEAGFKVVSWVEGGYEVTTVDYKVVRVSLLGMKREQLALLGKVMASSSVPEVRKMKAAMMERAQTRYDAKNSKDKRYVNVHGGHSDLHSLGEMVLELTKAGLGNFVSLVDGPFLRSTSGHMLTHMPLDPSTTYKTMHKIFDWAFEKANPEGDPDPWLDLQGLDEPLWGHHSMRRCADTVARATMARSGVSEMDIDRVFGWLEAMYSQRMQYHYETRFNRDKRYKVTMYL